MSEPVASARGTVDISHHLLYPRDGMAEPPLPLEPRNGLAIVEPGIVEPGIVVIFTGIASGPAHKRSDRYGAELRQSVGVRP